MPKMSEAFPSKYLCAADLRSQPSSLVMGVVEMEPVGRENEIKPVLYFKGRRKGMVLNKTNSNAIVAQYGDDSDMWAGRTITIYPTTTDMAGDIVPCVRVQPPGMVPNPSDPPPANAPLGQAAVAAGGNGQSGDQQGGGAAALDDDIPFGPAK